jgi:hypothetical protein
MISPSQHLSTGKALALVEFLASSTAANSRTDQPSTGKSQLPSTAAHLESPETLLSADETEPASEFCLSSVPMLQTQHWRVNSSNKLPGANHGCESTYRTKNW